MLPSDCYIDALWLEAYDNQTGQEFELSQVVIGTPAEVFDAWIHDVWLAGGDQVHEGVGRGYVGSVRRVPLHVEEEILSAGIPEASVGEQSASIKIPSICYRVCKPGPFPLQSHLAMVRFFLRTSGVAASKTPTTLVVNHLDPTRYVDAQAFEKYQHYKGQELVVSECIVGSPSEVFDAWLEQVWLAGGSELHEGEGRGYVGHVRGAPLGIEEEILSAGLPIDDP
ncbi:hypothetical protein PInf_012555 [Phytophthora infestans]|nr:hypothetical protein PInf_012555 [Phytophthora infestans]